MKVLLTGGTGYIGSFALQALLAAGHEPRLLVRDPAKLAAKAAAVGVDAAPLDVVVGDMTDADVVRRAVRGVDAVIHSAAAVGALNRSEAERALETNVAGARLMLDAALDEGCDPVVYVSSVLAIFRPDVAVVTADLPPAVGARNPYTRSKALAEQLARDRQAQGAPVVIFYPGGVTGPAAGDSYGEVAEGFVSMLKAGVLVLADGCVTVIDVRDLAAALVAALEPGKGPRRFMAGGQVVPLREIATVIRQTTGRRFPVLPTPGAVFRGLGHVTDAIRRLVPFETVFTAEAMNTLTLMRPTDDSAIRDELGVVCRDPIETIVTSLRALHAGGVLSAKHVGRLATG